MSNRCQRRVMTTAINNAKTRNFVVGDIKCLYPFLILISSFGSAITFPHFSHLIGSSMINVS